MMDFIAVGILVVILGAAIRYVYQAKKSGKHCVGCPEGCSCSSKEGSTSCHCCDTHQE